MQSRSPTTTIITGAWLTHANDIVMNINIPDTSTGFTPNGNSHPIPKDIVSDGNIVRRKDAILEATIHRAVQKPCSVCTTSSSLDGNMIITTSYIVVLNHHMMTGIRIDTI